MTTEDKCMLGTIIDIAIFMVVLGIIMFIL